jgi:hypothetical protein
MLYKDFEYDFVERTLKNLRWIEVRWNQISQEKTYDENFYEFTNLVNQCLGLIVFPKEFSNDTLIDQLPQELKYYGIDDGIVKKIKDNNVTLRNVLYHLRNGIAHGHILQYSNNNEDITYIKIFDANPQVCNPTEHDAHTIFEFSIEELKKMAIKIAEEYCRLKIESLEQTTSL